MEPGFFRFSPAFFVSRSKKLCRGNSGEQTGFMLWVALQVMERFLTRLWLLSFGLFFCVSVLKAEVTGSASIAGILQGYANRFGHQDWSKRWVIVDLDNTLFEARQALGHADHAYTLVQGYLKNNPNAEQREAWDEMYREWAPIQEQCEVCLVDPWVEVSFDNVQQSFKGVVFGLTHRRPCVAADTLRQVESVGVCFDRNLPRLKTQDHAVNLGKNNWMMWLRGILFVGDYNSKSAALKWLFENIEEANWPETVFFFDDKEDNVQDLEKFFDGLNKKRSAEKQIEFIGVHFRPDEDQRPSCYREEWMKIQKVKWIRDKAELGDGQLPKRIMSNQEAEVKLKRREPSQSRVKEWPDIW